MTTRAHLVGLFLLAGCGASSPPVQRPIRVFVEQLEQAIVVPPSVFVPQKRTSQPMWRLLASTQLRNPGSVLEIGTGSGVLSLILLRQGATHVVATDINPAAIDAVRMNAAAAGYQSNVDARLVSGPDFSA